MKYLLRLFLYVGTLVLLFSCEQKEELKLGSLCGTIVDKNTSKPIRNAGVELKSTDLVGLTNTVTGSDGYFEFTELNEGIYNLYITKSGYKEYTIKDIYVKGSSTPQKMNIQLEPLPPALTITDGNQHEIDSIDFGALEGEVQRAFNIFNNSEDKLEWSIEYVCDWIKFSKREGILNANQTQAVVCTIERSLLKIGENTTIVHVVSNNGSKELKIKATSQSIIETLNVNDPDSHSAVLQAKVVRLFEPAITEYGFVYSTKETPTLNNGALKISNQGTPQIGKYEMKVGELEKDTKYYVCAFVTNGEQTYYGNQITFNTISHVPDIIIHNTYDYEKPIPTATTITLLYSVTDDGGLPIEEVGICWDTNRMPTKENNYLKTGNTKETRKKVTISNLSPGTAYYFRAYAKNSEEEKYSIEIPIQTMTGTPIVELSAVSTTATTASATIKVRDAGGAELQSCGILWSEDPNTVAQGHRVEADGTQVNKAYVCDISGLTPHTTYYLCAYATTNISAHNSAIDFFTTDKGEPKVTTIGEESKGTNFLVISGSAKTTSDAPITRQGICWSTIPYPSTEDNVVEASVNSSTFSCRIEGLQSGTTYYCRAFAENSYGLGYGDQLSPTTAYDPTILTGHVYDMDNKPVHGATVSVVGYSSYHCTTDNDGYYYMELGSISGTHELNIVASNYKQLAEYVTFILGQSNQHDFYITLKNKFAIDFGTGLFVNPGEAWEMYFECSQTHLSGQTTTRNMRIKNYRSVPVAWNITDIPSTGISFSKTSGTIPALGEVSITITFRYPSTSSYMVSLQGCSSGSKTYIWNWGAAYGGYYINNGSAIQSACNACCWHNPVIMVDNYSEAFTLLFNQFLVWY